MYTNIRPSEEDTNLKLGHGSKIKKTDVLHTQGNMLPTQRDLDFGLLDHGMFAIDTTEGIKYTRNGNFEMSNIGGQFFLTGSQGGFVLDSNGEPIEVTSPDQDFDIGVYTFTNYDGLKIEGGMFFTPTETSGEAVVKVDPDIKRGYLEASNVDTAQTMSDVIQAQRAFQFNSRMVQAADEVMQTVNSLR